MKVRFGLLAVVLAATGLTTAVNAALPDPGMEIVGGRTALVITDPQNDFLRYFCQYPSSTSRTCWKPISLSTTARWQKYLRRSQPTSIINNTSLLRESKNATTTSSAVHLRNGIGKSSGSRRCLEYA